MTSNLLPLECSHTMAFGMKDKTMLSGNFRCPFGVPFLKSDQRDRNQQTEDLNNIAMSYTDRLFNYFLLHVQ